VLWELLVGRRLYKAENDLATLQMIINSKPQPPSQARADCPMGLDAIVLRALSANVSDRYQSAEDMQNDLDALARDQRYDPSAGAIRAMMQDLFDAELKVWMDSQAAGQTLIDHVLAAQPTVILPATDSDLSDEDLQEYEIDDDEPEESEADSELGTYSPSTLDGSPPTAPQRSLADEALTLSNEDSFPTQQLNLPVPTIQLSVAPPPNRPHSELRALSEVSPQFGLGRVNTPAPFPLAPASWRRATEPAPVVQDSQEVLTKHILIASSVLLAIIVLLAVAFGGGADPRAPANTEPTGSMPAAKDKVEMTVVPAAP
jgi:serine/threonine protein kinase